MPLAKKWLTSRNFETIREPFGPVQIVSWLGNVRLSGPAVALSIPIIPNHAHQIAAYIFFIIPPFDVFFIRTSAGKQPRTVKDLLCLRRCRLRRLAATYSE